MSEPQYPPIMPSFAVSDCQASIEWFEKLGFVSLGAATMPDGTIMHAELSRGPARIMLGPSMGGLGAPGLELYMNLGNESVDALYESVRTAGVTISEEIQDQFWGDRTFKVQHPDGYAIMFAQTVRVVAMEEIDEYLKQHAETNAGTPA